MQPPFEAVSGHVVRVSLQNFLVCVVVVPVVVDVLVAVVDELAVIVVVIVAVDVVTVEVIGGGAVPFILHNLASSSTLRSPPPQTQHASFALIPFLLLAFTLP